MSLAIFFLLIVFALKGFVAAVPSLGVIGVILAWPIAIFLGISVLVDTFVNGPRFLSTEPPETVADAVDRWKKAYIFHMGISLILRLVAVGLLARWFLLPGT